MFLRTIINEFIKAIKDKYFIINIKSITNFILKYKSLLNTSILYYNILINNIILIENKDNSFLINLDFIIKTTNN